MELSVHYVQTNPICLLPPIFMAVASFSCKEGCTPPSLLFIIASEWQGRGWKERWAMMTYHFKFEKKLYHIYIYIYCTYIYIHIHGSFMLFLSLVRWWIQPCVACFGAWLLHQPVVRKTSGSAATFGSMIKLHGQNTDLQQVWLGLPGFRDGTCNLQQHCILASLHNIAYASTCACIGTGECACEMRSWFCWWVVVSTCFSDSLWVYV